jgi:hypothetical protein
MKARKLKVLHCWNTVGPDGRVKQEWADTGIVKELSEPDIDKVRKVAKKMLRELGYDVRCISFIEGGHLQAMVWRDGKPQVNKDKHMVWKTPPSSSADRDRPRKSASKR